MAISDWDTVPANNATKPGINWAEGMTPPDINNSARQMMADVAVYRNTVDGHISALAGVGGSALVGFKHPGTGSVLLTQQTVTELRVNVKFFGAKGDGATTDTAAFKAARDFLQTASDYRGGVIEIPPGVYMLDDEWTFSPYAAGQVFNIIIQGAGMEATTLDFSRCAAGRHGISATGKGANFFVFDLSVKYAKAVGVVIKGGALGGTDFIQRCGLRNVRIQGSGTHGFYSENSFMLTLDHVWSWGGTGAGIFFAGFHTSVAARTCWASSNSDTGWRLNGLVYSTFDACGSDGNLYGWRVTNCNGVKLNGCGAEDSVRDSIFLETSTALAAGLPADAVGITMVIDSFFATRGSTVGAFAYSNFLAALTADGIAINVTTIGNVSRQGTSTAKALVINAAAGAIDVWGHTTMGNSYDSAIQNTGGTLH